MKGAKIERNRSYPSAIFSTEILIGIPFSRQKFLKNSDDLKVAEKVDFSKTDDRGILPLFYKISIEIPVRILI